jgi:ATP-dependent protease HslVU (ClpYQ) peptidase subunit
MEGYRPGRRGSAEELLRALRLRLGPAMTWVFGSASFLGSAILVGDVQVTLGDGRTLDCLQKVHALDHNVLGGFAGDVYAGFALLSALQRFIHQHEAAVPIESVFDAVPRIARETFARLDAPNQSGSALLIAGASPQDNALYGSRPELARFRDPNFDAEEIAMSDWAAIGSGSEVEAYRLELQSAMSDEARSLLAMEANNPGGFLNTMTIPIISNVFDMPSVPGIAKHFHVGTVFADRCWIRTSDREHFPADGPPQQIRMPPVATNWSELQALLRQQLGSAVTALSASRCVSVHQSIGP